MKDPRLTEIDFLADIDRKRVTSITIHTTDEQHRYGLPVQQFKELVYELIEGGQLNGPALMFLDRDRSAASDPIAMARRKSQQTLQDLNEGKSTRLALTHRGRVHLVRLRDEMLSNRDREQFDILWDRRAWDRALAIQLGMAAADNPVAILLMDLDHFKTINDTHGHPVGDEVLKAAFKLMREVTDDRAYRFGGEEVGAILPGVNIDKAADLAEQVRSLIESQVVKAVEEIKEGPVTVSIGVGTFTIPTPPEEAVKTVDQLLYVAKNAGRNRVETQLA